MKHDRQNHLGPCQMNKALLSFVGFSFALLVHCSVSFSCELYEIKQEISKRDTLNSSGNPLGSSYLVFQQDRYFVNAKNQLDPEDRKDPVMTSKNARQKYGQAISEFIGSSYLSTLPPKDLIGKSFIINVKVCGDDISIEAVSETSQMTVGELVQKTETLQDTIVMKTQLLRLVEEREKLSAEYETKLSDINRRIKELETATGESVEELLSAVDAVPVQEFGDQIFSEKKPTSVLDSALNSNWHIPGGLPCEKVVMRFSETQGIEAKWAEPQPNIHFNITGHFETVNDNIINVYQEVEIKKGSDILGGLFRQKGKYPVFHNFHWRFEILDAGLGTLKLAFEKTGVQLDITEFRQSGSVKMTKISETGEWVSCSRKKKR